MHQSAELLVCKGCTLVLDLDGGGSAAMIYNHNGEQTVLNGMYGSINWNDDEAYNIQNNKPRQAGRSISDYIFVK